MSRYYEGFKKIMTCFENDKLFLIDNFEYKKCIYRHFDFFSIKAYIQDFDLTYIEIKCFGKSGFVDINIFHNKHDFNRITSNLFFNLNQDDLNKLIYNEIKRCDAMLDEW